MNANSAEHSPVNIVVKNDTGDPVLRQIQHATDTQIQHAINQLDTVELHEMIFKLCQNINYLEHALDPR